MAWAIWAGGICESAMAVSGENTSPVPMPRQIWAHMWSDSGEVASAWPCRYSP
ncbi:hypothetical protein D3C72_2491910 [compost metagenome]